MGVWSSEFIREKSLTFLQSGNYGSKAQIMIHERILTGSLDVRTYLPLRERTIK